MTTLFDHALFQPFANRWNVGKQTFEWTTLDNDLFLRPHGAPLCQVWALLNWADLGPQLALPRARCGHLFSASEKVHHALQGRLFWRLWPLCAHEIALLRPHGSLLRAEGLSTVRFSHETLREFDTVDDQILAQWSQELEAPDSDLHRARHWQRLSEAERITEIVRVGGGSWDELMALIHAACVLWARSDSRFELDFTKVGVVALNRAFYWHTPPEPIDDALEILSLHWTLQRIDLQDCTRYWRECDEFGDPMDVPQPKFGFNNPSQHQRLEALMLWRDWLRDKSIPPSFKALWDSALT